MNICVFLFVLEHAPLPSVVLHAELQFIYMYTLCYLILINHCCISSKFIDSTHQLKIFWRLLIRSCLLVGHVPIYRITVSRCALVLSQWNRR
jgi:hypothetical protein